MASDGGGEDLLDWLSAIEFPSLDQLLSEEGFPMAEPSDDGVSGAQDNNAQTADQQRTQTAVATPHAQGDPDRTLESLSALNLKCEKTIFMLKKAEAVCCEGRVDRQTWKALGSQMFKAKSEPFSVLRIGRYEIRPRYSSHLIAKWYYTKKRLNWEILENGLKKKIEISWPDISAMRVEYGDDVEILEIEVSHLTLHYVSAKFLFHDWIQR
ncbi:uncharacterized protein LOC125315505 [Rhodamnia argentea]|uniref:Uncharacterized protein LOC125315505 n=1 Tax=Rhodamnia argentea TaxID=178133 RepID=A0ABM3HJ39_9MYRT|nr:uncharacterized protein LOC125315505 [Rhodamnia argentea]